MKVQSAGLLPDLQPCVCCGNPTRGTQVTDSAGNQTYYRTHPWCFRRMIEADSEES